MIAFREIYRLELTEPKRRMRLKMENGITKSKYLQLDQLRSVGQI
jgi:hypothetical protein